MALLLGGFCGGQIYNLYGYMPVMIMSPIIYFIAITYVIFLLKDTKPKVCDSVIPQIRKKDLKNWNLAGSLYVYKQHTYKFVL